VKSVGITGTLPLTSSHAGEAGQASVSALFSLPATSPIGMNGSDMEFKWLIWPPSDFFTLFDNFCCNGIRLRLEGHSITVSLPDAPDAETKAKAVAERYLQSLCDYAPISGRLTTPDEISQMPPGVQSTMITNSPQRPTERTRLQAIKIARESLVPQEVLRKCYDYLQDANEEQRKERSPMGYLYKFAETIKNYFGTGWDDVGHKLGVRSELKDLKRLANEGVRDERHPPKPNEPAQPLSVGERANALASATTVLRSFEAHLGCST
jgi:hypothetical protein